MEEGQKENLVGNSQKGKRGDGGRSGGEEKRRGVKKEGNELREGERVERGVA